MITKLYFFPDMPDPRAAIVEGDGGRAYAIDNGGVTQGVRMDCVMDDVRPGAVEIEGDQ